MNSPNRGSSASIQAIHSAPNAPITRKPSRPCRPCTSKSDALRAEGHRGRDLTKPYPRTRGGVVDAHCHRSSRTIGDGQPDAQLAGSTYARHRIRHGIRHTTARAGRRSRPPVANDRFRHRLIRSARVSTADGSPSLDLQRDFVGLYYRGQRRTDLEREYLKVYHLIDERVPRVRQLPDSHLVRIKDLYTAEELKTSLAYNEILLRGKYQNGLNVRLDGPDSSHMTWGLGDPVALDGWGSSQIAMIKKLLPHIRQFIRVRQTLVRAQDAGHDRDRPARQPSDRRSPPGPA